MTFRILFRNLALLATLSIFGAGTLLAQDTGTSVVANSDLPSFESALAALHNGDNQKALDELRVLLGQTPHDPALLTNAGIAAARLENWGLAAGLLRDAVEIAPSENASRQALDFVLEKLPVKEISHRAQFWEVYRQKVLTGIPLYALALIGAPLVLLVGLLVLRYIADRRRALLDEEPLPRIGFAHVAALLLLTLHLGLLLTKIIDRGQPRATITETKIAAHSAPDAGSPSLFELFAGFEVLVLRENEAWAQVRYPGGPTGWVPKSALHFALLPAGG